MSPEALTWEPLVSSHISDMAYDADSALLYIRYQSGAVYRVTASQEEADGLRTATSPGRYTNLMFKGKMSRVE